MTRKTTKWTTLGLLAGLGTAALSPMAMADSRQNDKNNMRNLGIAGAAVAALGLLKHDNTLTLLGAAAGGYGAYKYEQDRKAQSQQNSRWYYYSHNGRRGWRR